MNSIYHADHLKRTEYTVPLDEQETILKALDARTDTQGKRLKDYLALPDLTRQDGSPVKTITERVLNVNSLQGFDLITIPSVTSPTLIFDLFNFPKDHPARSGSDTYYVDDTHILRSHVSHMWKYYLDIPEVREKLHKYGSVGAICYGTVYRRDEIDWQHSNVLHHIDGLFICRKDIKVMKQIDLENILTEVAQSLFGQDVKGMFAVDRFPYTDPSIEMNISWDDAWVEILGAGIPHPAVIKNLGLDPELYTGWAFGLGADRLAMIKMRIPDIRLLRSEDPRVLKQFENIDQPYTPVSKYPAVIRDISFIVNNATFNIHRYYELIREVIGGDMVEEMKLLDQFENETKLGAGKTSYTFRITYRSIDRTLTNDEVNAFHKQLEAETQSVYDAVIR